MRVHVDPAATKRQTIQAIYRALDAPNWARANLDALADVLRDLSWLPVGAVTIDWRVSAELPTSDQQAIAEVLSNAVSQAHGSQRALVVNLEMPA